MKHLIIATLINLLVAARVLAAPTSANRLIVSSQPLARLSPSDSPTSIGSIAGTSIGLTRIDGFLVTSSGNLVIVGLTTDGTYAIVLRDTGSGAVTTVRKFTEQELWRGVRRGFFVAAFHDEHGAFGPLPVRLVVVYKLGEVSPTSDLEQTRTIVEIIAASGASAGKLLGTAQIADADIDYSPRSSGPYKFGIASGVPPESVQSVKNLPGHVTRTRLFVSEVGPDSVADLLIWQRHLISPPPGESDDLVTERETWMALTSQQGDTYTAVPEVKGVPDAATMLWETTNLGFDNVLER